MSQTSLSALTSLSAMAVRQAAVVLPLCAGSALALGLCWQLSLLDSSTANASEDEAAVALLRGVDAGDVALDQVEAGEGAEGWEGDSPELRAELERMVWLERFVFGSTAEQRAAAEALVTLEATDWPADYRGTFLRALAPGVLQAAHDFQVPPSVTLAQAVLESGWGRSSLASRYHNLFGVKAMRGLPVVTLDSAEIIDGVRVPMKLRFAVFEDWDHAVVEHGELLSHKRYDRAREHWTEWDTFVGMIAPMYASDPNYARRIGIIVREYGLDRWDELIIASVDMAATAPDDSGVAEPGASVVVDDVDDLGDVLAER